MGNDVLLLLELLEKGSTPKEEKMIRRGANSFLLELTPFQRGFMCRIAKQEKNPGNATITNRSPS